jgi:Ca-activated chloride channel homolog
MNMRRQTPRSAVTDSPADSAAPVKNGPTRRIVVATLVLIAGVLLAGTWRNPHFWLTADQKGARLFAEKRYAEAAKVYTDPWRIGVAQYRDGAFETAARTLARVPGADGAFDQGNAWLMRGNYAAAVASYDRALDFRPGWKEAEENKALALARKKMLEDSNKDAGEEQQGDDDPGKIVFDLKKGEDKGGKPVEMAEGKLSDEQMRALWLRRVQTTPGDFLRAKFSYQAAAGGTEVRE